MTFYKRHAPNFIQREGVLRDRPHDHASTKYISTLNMNLTSSSKAQGLDPTGVNIRAVKRTSDEHQNLQINKWFNNSRTDSVSKDRIDLRSKVTDIDPILWKKANKKVDKGIDGSPGVDAPSSTHRQKSTRSPNWKRQKVESKLTKHQDACPVRRDTRSSGNKQVMDIARSSQHVKRSRSVNASANETKQLTDVTNYRSKTQNKTAKKAKLTEKDSIIGCISRTTGVRTTGLSSAKKCNASQENQRVIKNSYQAIERPLIGHSAYEEGINSQEKSENYIVNILKSENTKVCAKQNAVVSDRFQTDELIDSNSWPDSITANKLKSSESTDDMLRRKTVKTIDAKRSTSYDSKQCLLKRNANRVDKTINVNIYKEQSGNLENRWNSKLPKLLCNTVKQVTHAEVLTNDNVNDKGGTTGGLNADDDVENTNNTTAECQVLSDCTDKTSGSIDDKTANLDKSVNIQPCNKSNFTTQAHPENWSSECSSVVNEITENIRQGYDSAKQTDYQEVSLDFSSNLNQLSVSKIQGKDLDGEQREADGPGNKRGVTSHITKQRLSRGRGGKVAQQYKAYRSREERSPSFLSWESFHFPENFDVDRSDDLKIENNTDLEKTSNDDLKSGLQQKDGDLQNSDSIKVDNLSIDGDECFIPNREHNTGNVKVRGVNTGAHLTFDSNVHTHEQKLYRDEDTNLNIYNRKYSGQIKTDSNGFIRRELNVNGGVLDGVVKNETDLNKVSRDSRLLQGLSTQKTQHEQEAFRSGITRLSFSPGTGNLNHISVNTGGSALKSADKHSHYISTSCNASASKKCRNPYSDLVTSGSVSSNLEVKSEYNDLEEDGISANIEHKANVQVDLSTIRRGHAHGHGQRSLTTYTQENTRPHIDGNEACLSNKKSAYYTSHHDQTKTDLLYDGLKSKGVSCSENTLIKPKLDELGSVSNNTSLECYRSSIGLTGGETKQDTCDAVQANREQSYVTNANDKLGDRSSHNDEGTSSSKKTSSSLQETDDNSAATCRDGTISDGLYDPMICDEQVPAVTENRTTDVGLQKQQRNGACVSVSTVKVKISTKSSPVLGVRAKDFCYQTGPSNSPVVGENEKKRNAATGSQNKMNKNTYLQDKSTKTKTTSSFSNLKLAQSTLNNAKKRETERPTSSKLTRKISSSDTDELSNPSRRVNSGSLSAASNKTVGHRASLQRKNGTGEKVKLRSPGNGDNEITDSRLSKRIYNRAIDKSTLSNCASQRAKSTTSRQDSSEKLLKKNGSSTLVSKQSRSFNVKEDANKKSENNESTTQSISHRDIDDDSVKKRCKTLAKNDDKNSGVIRNGAEPVSHTLTEEVDDYPIQIDTCNWSEEFTSDPEIVAHRQTERNNGLTLSADRKVNKTPGNTTGVHIDSATQLSNLRRTRNQANINIGTCAKTNSSSADRENNSKTCSKNSNTTRKFEKPKSLGSVKNGAKTGKKNEGLLNSIVGNSEQKRSKSSVTLPVSSVADDHFGHRAKSRSIIREQKYQQKSLPTSPYSIIDPLNPISSKAFVRNVQGNGCSGEQKFGTVLRVYEDAPLSGCVQSCCSQLSAINLRTTATFNLATNTPAWYQQDCIADGRVLTEPEVNNCKYCYGSSDVDKVCDHCAHSKWEKSQTSSQCVRFNSSNQSACNEIGKLAVSDNKNIQHGSKGNGTLVTYNDGDYDVSNQKQCLLLLNKQNSQATLPAESQNCVSDSKNLDNDRYMDDYSHNDMDIVNSTTFHVKEKLADDNKICFDSMDSNKGKYQQKYDNSQQENFDEKNIGNKEISRVTQNLDEKGMDVISSESDDVCHEQVGSIGEVKIGERVEEHSAVGIILRTTPDDRHGSEWNTKSPDITTCTNEVMNNYDNSYRPGVDISNVEDNAIDLHKQNGDTGPGGLLEYVTNLSSSEDVVDKQTDSQIKEQRLFNTTGKDKHECVENVTLVSETCVTESEYSHFKAETEYRDLHSEVKCDLIGKYTKEKDTPLSQKEGLEASGSSNKGFNPKSDNLSDVLNSHASPDGSEKTLFQNLTSQREGYVTDSSPVASLSPPVSAGSDSLGNMCTNCPLAMDNNQLKDVKPTLTKKKQRIPQATKFQRTKFVSNTTVSTQRHLVRKQTIAKDSGIKSGSKTKVQHMPIVSDKKNKITKESSLSRESSPTHSVKSDDTWTSCSTTGTKRLSISSKDSCDLKKFVSIKEKKETCDTRNMKAKRSDSRLNDNKLQIEKRKISGDAECSGSMNYLNGRRSSNVSNKSIPTGNANNHKSQLKKPVDTKSKHKSHLVKPQMKSSSSTKTSSSKLSVTSTMKEKDNKRKEFDSEVDNSGTVQDATKLSLPVDGRENNDDGKLPTSLSSPLSATNHSEQCETLVCKTKNKTDVNSSVVKCYPNGSVNPKLKTLNQGINHPPRSLQTQNKSSGRSSLLEKSSIKQQKSCRNATGSKANDLENDGNRLLVNGNIRKSGIPSPVPRTGSSISTKQKANNKPGFEIKKPSSVSGPCKKENKSPSGSKHKTDDVTAKQSTRIKPETRCKTDLRQSPVITRRKSKEPSPDSTRTSRSSTPSGSDKGSVNNDNAPKSILNLVRTKTAKQTTSRLVQPKSGVPRLSKQFPDQNLKKQSSVCDNVKEKQNKKLEKVRIEREQLKNCKVKTENIEADCNDDTIRESDSGGSLKDIVLSHISSGYSREVIVSSLPVSESFENSSGVDSPFTTPPESNKPFNSWRNSIDLDNKQLSLGENDRNVTVKLTDTHLAGSETERPSPTEADDDTCTTLNTLHKTMCEISTVAESLGNSKTVNKVLKSDLVDQLPQSPLSNTKNVKDIKELGTTCRQNIKLDMVSTEVNLEQLSSNVFERSKISSIEKHNRELMHMQVGNQDCGALHQGRCGSKSDSGSSDDYWSISDDDNDNYNDGLVDDKVIVTSDIHVPHDKRNADSDASINNDPNTKDVGHGHTLTRGGRENSCAVPEDERFSRHAATVKEINFNATNCDDKTRGYGEDISCSENRNAIHSKTENDILNKREFDNNSSEEIKTETRQEIYTQTGVPHVRLVSDDHFQQIVEHDARMRETADDNIVNELHSHSKDVQEQTVDDLYLNNKTSFDLIHENITHHEKSDEDMETILINSSESSETRGNCAKDKNQYVSTDYEEKLPEQAILGEYFDDGIDKLEMQAKELNKGDRELLKSIKLSGSSYQPTEESLRGSMDNISHLSFSQNILTHQNNQDVLCSRTIRNKTQHTQLSSALLTPEHLEKPVTRVNEEPNAANDVRVLDQELETKILHDIINKNCEKVFGEFKSSRDQSSNGIYVKNENHEFDTKEEGCYMDVYKNSTVLKSPESSEDVIDNRQCVSNGTCESVYGLENNTDKTGKTITDDINLSTDTNICGKNTENYDELSISEEDDSEDMTGQMGFYQANMAAKTLKPGETGETSSTIVAPQTTISHSETCIKYEIVTTTITKHKKRETKIIESCSSGSNSNLSTTNSSACDSAVLHEKHVTSPRKVRNSRSVKFESKEVKTSKSDSQGNVYSSVTNTESKQVVESGIGGESKDGDGSCTVDTASILNETGNNNAIENPVNVSESFNVDNEVELQERLCENIGNGASIVNSGLNTNNQGNGTETHQQGNNKLKNIHGYPDLSSHVTGGQFSKLNDATFKDIECRNESTLRFNLVTTGENRDNGDSVGTRTDIKQPIKSRTELTNAVHNSENDDCQTSSSFKQVNASIVSVIDKRDLKSTCSIDHQTDLSESGIKEIETFKTSSNAVSLTERLNTQDNLMRGDTGLLGNNSTEIPGESSTSNTSNAKNIYENKMGIGDNTFDNHTSLQSRIETPKVAILVTRNQSESDNGEESSDPDAEDDQNITDSAISENKADNSKFSKAKHDKMVVETKLCPSDTSDTEQLHSNVVDSVSLVNTLPEPEQVTNIEEENYFTVTLPVPRRCVSVTLESSLSTGDLYNSEPLNQNLELNTADTEVCFSLEPLNSSNDTLPDIEQTIVLAENSSENILRDESLKHASESCSTDVVVKTQQMKVDCLDVPDRSVTSNENDNFKNSANEEDGDFESDNTTHQTENTDDIKSQKREIDRQNLRRYTATVCLVDIKEGNSDSAVATSPPSRPRARSKSPVELKNMGAIPESKQQVSVFGNGRVSNICRTFIEKSRSKGKRVNNEPPPSPLNQSPSPTRKQKWLRDNGVWKKVSLDEYERIMSAKANFSSITSDDTLNTSADDDQLPKEVENRDQTVNEAKISSEATKEESSQCNKPQKGEVSTPEGNLCKNKAGHTPKIPPKTLPKPKYRRKSKDPLLRCDSTSSSISTPEEITNIEETINNTLRLDASFDADKTLVAEGDILNTSTEKNWVSEKIIDSSSDLVDKTPDVQVVDDIAEKSDDKENLSNISSLSYETTQTAEDSRPVVTLSGDLSDAISDNLDGSNDVSQDEESTNELQHKSSTDSLNVLNLKLNHTSENKDKNSPQDDLSFAEKLKKAEHRFGKCSPAVLESKDVFKPRRKERVTLQPLKKKNDNLKLKETKQKCDVPPETKSKPENKNLEKTNDSYVAPALVTRSPQKLRAVRIKQEIFPKEEPVTIQTPKLTAIKISQETFPKEETKPEKPETEFGGNENLHDFQQQQNGPGQGSLRRDPTKKKDPGVKFYVGDEDAKSWDGVDEEESVNTDDNLADLQQRHDSVVKRLFGTKQFPKRCINPFEKSDNINVNIRELTYQRRDLQLQSDFESGVADSEETLGCSNGSFGLLSEIVELEENNGDDSRDAVDYSSQLNQDNGKRVWQKSSSAAERFPNKSPVPCPRTYSRSHSLPSGTLSYPGSRIVYKDGHFVIETGYCEESSLDLQNEELSPRETIQEGITDKCDQSESQDKDITITDENRKKLKRISYSEPQLCDNEDDYDEEENLEDYDADVFLQNDGDVTVIDTDESCDYSPVKPAVPRRNKPDRDCRIPRPLSVDENQLLALKYDSEPHDSPIKQMKKSVRDAKARRSKSFKEMSDRIDNTGKLKRNSSFKEAQEKGPLKMSPYIMESRLSRSDSTGSSREELRPKSPGFLQRLLFKRKSFSEKGSKPGDAISRESFMKKMSLKGLFANKKDKPDSNSSKNNEPQSPPIAAFQGDHDIHAVDSAPNSPFTNLKFRRRHTSADIYSQNQKNNVSNNTTLNNVRRTSECQQNRPGVKEDQTSIKSYTLGLDHPKRPISPKPSTVSITRRNSNLSLPSSPLKESPFELSIDNSPNKFDTDSISTCSINSSNLDSSSLVSATNQSICDSSEKPSLSKQSSASSSIVSPTSQDLEKLSNLVQGGEMTSSNSNDSGIQHDVSAHSSSESLKTSSHDSSSSVIRRRKSPSPRPERPKSEISVRWADLVETNEITPVKRRESSQRNRPRPKSDIEENLELFDELCGEVIGDYDSLSGGSSLKSDMKPFGSEMSLQPYCSLQSLDSLRIHQEAQDQKPSKRRMSTPQPIKTRLDRSPRKRRQRKSSQLVRSQSMPESLDKLHRRKRLHNMLGYSNLHGEDFLNPLEEDSSSDDGSEFSIERISLNEKCMSTRSSQAQLSTLDEMPEGENLTFAEALWDHITMDTEELGFHAGDVIEVMDIADRDWWWGAIDDREGWFPATFVRLRVNQERFEEEIISQSGTSQNLSPTLRRVSILNKEQARENVVNEIISAEREYVKHLKDVVEGYIKHARKRQDMFSEDRICVIFGNIEEIYNFSNRFLQSLDDAFNADSPHFSELGHCFLTHSKEFEIYSDYCNNHPSASEELKDLYRKQKYRHFFEACRLLQEMIEIPLEGFLLTPVQKICKYPLQLAELLKFTPSSHPDFNNVQAALEAMKKIAALINERKRKMESIEKLARWQHTVEDWQGPDLLELSSELIMSGEFNKVNSAGWSQERYFFLFDHQLIYCKKDLLKKNGFSYKGRVDMDECEVIPVEDGKDVQYNVTVKNAWKLHETLRDKWYLLYTKTPTEKQRWLRAFQTERQRVQEDQENNFVPVHWKKTVLNKLRASKEKQQSTRNMPIQYQKEFLRGIPSHATLPRSYAKKHKEKKKAWSIFGNKKTK